MIRRAPFVLRIRETDVEQSDLLKELKIDKHKLDRNLLEQPGVYAWWSGLLAEVSSKADKLDMELEELYAELAGEYAARAGNLTKSYGHKAQNHP